MDANKLILKRPIGELEVSDDFRKMCDLNGFKTLGDIVKFRAAELTKKPGFGMRILLELIEVLRKNGLEKCLKN